MITYKNKLGKKCPRPAIRRGIPVFVSTDGKFDCPACKAHHIHGAMSGHRTSHCFVKQYDKRRFVKDIRPFPHGYILKDNNVKDT